MSIKLATINEGLRRVGLLLVAMVPDNAQDATPISFELVTVAAYKARCALKRPRAGGAS